MAGGAGRWVVLLLVATADLAVAQDSVTVAAGDSVAAGKAAEDTPDLLFSGYVTTSYTWASEDNDGVIVGRFYDRYWNQFMLNAVKVVLERPLDVAKSGAGFRVDALFGENATVLQTADFNLGTNGDIIQAFAALNFPTGEATYVQLRGGKYATPMGFEVIEDVVNPNLSIGNQFVFLENFTQLGVGAYWKAMPSLELQFHILQGWDDIVDNNTNKSFMARAAMSLSPSTTLAALGYLGSEQQRLAGPKRFGGQLLLTTRLGPHVNVAAQGDYGEEEGLLLPDPSNATWWGIGGWIWFDLSPAVGLAFRGDYVSDSDGVRTSNYFYPPAPDRKFGQGTATLNVRAFSGFLLRPEVRVDYSNQEDFGVPGEAKTSQVSLGMGVSYIF